jgi:phenylalanyl-tRNA synthetase alpha chain
MANSTKESDRYVHEDEALCLDPQIYTTTGNTWCLHRLSKDQLPAQHFSVNRIFGNTEIYQVEGVVADFDLSLGSIMTFLDDVLKRLGLENIRFKPAYNPYTTPSTEIFAYHAGTWSLIS